MPLLLMIPKASVAQTNTEAFADAAILPWLGTWTAIDEAPASGTTVLEISPGAGGRGLDITTKTPDEPVSENIIPDGVSRAVESKTCTGTDTYGWERQAGVLLGTSEIVCQGEAYSIFTLKMMTSADLMTDILVLKTTDQTRLAVRRFAFEKELPTAGDYIRTQESLALRMALAAPWDVDKIIGLSKTLEAVVLEAALLEKNLQVKLDANSLRKMKSNGTPDSIIDLLVAMSAPDKFRIEKNEQIAVETASPSKPQNNEGRTYYATPAPYYYGYYNPWGYYWNYYSPFWTGYPIYMYPGYYGYPGYPGYNGGGGSGGDGGGSANGRPSGNSGGRLSAGSGYVQITPRETGHQAVPRGSVTPAGAGSARPGATGSNSSGSGASSSSSGSAGYSSGGGSVSSGASASPPASPSASPSGYSGGRGSGTAVPR